MAKTAEQKAEGAKNARLKRFFRLDLKEYKQVEGYQVRVGLGILLGTTRRALDHIHTTGQLRGILDWRINRALGWIEAACGDKTVDALYALASYIQAYPVTAVLGPRFGIIGKAKKKKKMVFGSPNGPIKESRS
jgi:hypothetical protein